MKMATESQPDPQINLLLADFNTRLRDIEERNRVVKERVLLLGQNMISSREEVSADLESLKKDSNQIKKDIEKMKNIAESLLQETDKLVRKDEIMLIERMLKDFQPLEFVRRKDIEDIVNQIISSNKKSQQRIENSSGEDIKTKKSLKKEDKEENSPRILDYGSNK